MMKRYGLILAIMLAWCASPAWGWQNDEAKKTQEAAEKAAAKAAAAASKAGIAAEEKPSKPERPSIYDEAADANAQITSAIDKARSENKRVLIQWGANWCGWCHLLHGTMKTNPQIARKIMYEYEVVLVDVGQMDKNTELAERFEADLKKNGLPFLTVLDGEGKVVVNQETSSLESKEEGAKGHNEEAVLEFLTKYEATPAQAESVLDAGMKQAKADGKLVFLHFGAPWCGWCHYLENWMAQPEVHSKLNAAFVDVKIDTDRMTHGQDVLKKYCEKQSGIPWFVFIDPADGSVVASSEAESGNVGFPSTDEEIEHFGKMLAGTKRFSAEEIDFFSKSLVENRKARESNRKR